jgi:hypothetical protein
VEGRSFDQKVGRDACGYVRQNVEAVRLIERSPQMSHGLKNIRNPQLPRVFALCVAPPLLLIVLSSAAPLCAQEKTSSRESLLNARPQAWLRRDKPVLTSTDPGQSWRKIVCYSPHVIHHDGKFHMWFLGTSTASRSNDIVLGYAQSRDGIEWKEHPGNPILVDRDVSWGKFWQTPFVLFDKDAGLFKMWFVSGEVKRDENNKIVANIQKLGYGVSRDGVKWSLHPEPIFPSGRSPSVIKEGPNRYRMWMNSSPDVEEMGGEIYTNIFEFTSSDGIRWQRGEQPVVRPSGPGRTVVYPFVLKWRRHPQSELPRRAGWPHGYSMWYGCHVEGGRFEIFCAHSRDGTTWKTDHSQPAFPAAADRDRFDGRYTSTPCVVRMSDRLMLYYSARDWRNDYIDSAGRRRRDGAGVYSHIGLGTMNIPPAQE